MTSKYLKNYIANNTYIKNHKLSKKVLQEHNIYLEQDEIYVKARKLKNYYISNYGNLVRYNRKTKNFKTVKPQTINSGYIIYTSYDKKKKKTRTHTAHSLVAEVFTPKYANAVNEEIHHIDKDISNNYYSNLIKLPRYLHTKANKIKTFAIKRNKTFKKINLYDLSNEYGISLEDILMVSDRQEPAEQNNKYTVYSINDILVGFEYYPTKKKKKRLK